jgi:DNA mismatch repair protein MutL
MNSATPNRIKVLSVQLVNKIAAGEVIERPASCVKELIENALDAGATDIEIAVKEGGKKLIRIVDNGSGIPVDDLPLVFKSHSTSKIAYESDLYNIGTFGFRGEALASMASVAQVRLVSKTPEQQEVYEISVNDNKITPSQPVAGVNGTTIEIANLFYQTPARRKFLKSDSVELSHISEMVTRFAIAYPQVSFSLINLPTRSSDGDNKQIIINLKVMPDNSSKSVLQRLAFFYGSAGSPSAKYRAESRYEADISKELLYVQEEQDGVKIEAYCSLPTYTKPTSKYQFFYLNRRFIRDRILSRAIYQAYHNLIPQGRYPFVLLFLQMSASAFDVNVHPTKIEVRFREAWRLHDQVISLIRRSLSEKISVEGQEIKSIEGQNISPADTIPLPLDESQRVMQALVDFFERSSSTHPAAQEDLRSHPSFSASSPSRQTQVDIREEWRGKVTHTGRCFQIHNSYIIDEVADGILIIDQHALHERILYERLSKQMVSAEIYRQRLLIPKVVEVPKPKMTLLTEAIPYLKAVGIEVEEFGENAIAIQSAPSVLNNVDLNEFITEFIDAFADDFPDTDKEKDAESKNIKPIDNLIKLMACKAAIKAGDSLSPEEIKALIADSSGIDWVTCPHGRPAIRKITLSELEGFFQR